jgi:hypothetical protein
MRAHSPIFGPLPFALVLLAACAVACADGTLAPRAANDPANPRAPEAPSGVDSSHHAATPAGQAP